MKLSKHDALALAKVLHNYVVDFYNTPEYEKSEHQETLEDLVERIDEFLLGCGEEGNKNEKDDSVSDAIAGEAEKKKSEEDEEVSDKESDVEDDESEELGADNTVYGDELHDLKAVRTDRGSLEFEAVEESDDVDVLIDGGYEYTITHVRRKSKQLEVRRKDNGEWVAFNVTKFPSGWTVVLPLNELVEVGP